MTAAIILFVWFLLIELIGGGLTLYSYIKDSNIEVPLSIWAVFIFVLPVLIAGCAEVIW